jgi:hypothetical protein
MKDTKGISYTYPGFQSSAGHKNSGSVESPKKLAENWSKLGPAGFVSLKPWLQPNGTKMADKSCRLA